MVGIDARFPPSMHPPSWCAKARHPRLQRSVLPPPKTKLGLVHEVGTQDGNVLTEPSQHRLADTKRLDRFLIGTSQKVLVVQTGHPEDIAEDMGKSDVHRGDPFHVPWRVPSASPAIW
jgi:hypothetical protein